MTTKYPNKLWVVLDHSGNVIQQTNDPGHLTFMKKYVDQALSVGDEWALVEYSMTSLVSQKPTSLAKTA